MPHRGTDGGIDVKNIFYVFLFLSRFFYIFQCFLYLECILLFKKTLELNTTESGILMISLCFSAFQSHNQNI